MSLIQKNNKLSIFHLKKHRKKQPMFKLNNKKVKLLDKTLSSNYKENKKDLKLECVEDFNKVFNEELIEDFNKELVEDFNEELVEDFNEELVEDFNEEFNKDFNDELEDELEDDELVSFNKKIRFILPMCHCIECFVYMGEMNPRQNCNKFKCNYDFFDEKEMLQIRVFHLRSSPYYNDPTFYGYPKYHNNIQKFIDDNYIENPDEKDNFVDNLNNPNNLD